MGFSSVGGALHSGAERVCITVEQLGYQCSRRRVAPRVLSASANLAQRSVGRALHSGAERVCITVEQIGYQCSWRRVAPRVLSASAIGGAARLPVQQSMCCTLVLSISALL